MCFEIPANSVIQSINAYPSKRRDGYEHYDLYSVAYLSDSQLMDYEYSDTYIKFMIQKYIKDKEISLELWKRDVRKKYEIVPRQPSKSISWLGEAHEIF